MQQMRIEIRRRHYRSSNKNLRKNEMIRRKKEKENGKIRHTDLSAFQQFFGYPKKRNLNTGHIAVRTGRSGIQYQNRKNNDGLSDSGGHRHFYFCMQYPDTGTGRYLSFFVHNRAWLTAAACEASLSGSMEAVRQDGQAQAAAEIRGEELGNVGFFGAENLRCHVNAGKKKVSVTYEADTIAGFGGFKWTLKTEGNSKVIRPVKWIRRLKAAKEVIGITGD